MDSELTDWVVRAKRRDAAAFTRLIRRCERTALAVAFAQLGNAAGAGDVVQEAFLKVWQKLGDLDDPSRFPAWLCGIVRNVAIDHRRRIKPGDPIASANSIEDTRACSDPAAGMEQADRRREIAAALDTLEEVSRSVLVLRYYENLSSREMGELLGMSVAAVDMRLSRARQAMRDRLVMLMSERSSAM